MSAPTRAVFLTIFSMMAVLMPAITLVTGAFFIRKIGMFLAFIGASNAVTVVILASNNIVRGVFIVVALLNCLLGVAASGGEK